MTLGAVRRSRTGGITYAHHARTARLVDRRIYLCGAHFTNGTAYRAHPSARSGWHSALYSVRYRGLSLDWLKRVPGIDPDRQRVFQEAHEFFVPVLRHTHADEAGDLHEHLSAWRLTAIADAEVTVRSPVRWHAVMRVGDDQCADFDGLCRQAKRQRLEHIGVGEVAKIKRTLFRQLGDCGQSGTVGVGQHGDRHYS